MPTLSTRGLKLVVAALEKVERSAGSSSEDKDEIHGNAMLHRPSLPKIRGIFCSLLVTFFAVDLLAIEMDVLLEHMDMAAERFRAMQADVRWLKYTDLVDDESIEKGTIHVMRDKKKQINLLIEFREPYPYFFSVRGTKIEIYRPKIATVEEYDLSKSREMLEQALLLGFGTAGRFLREKYELIMVGEEEAAGAAVVKIELVPKSEKLREHMPRLAMWISTADWQPVQEKIYSANPGDYRLYTYTNIKRNSLTKESALKLKIPSSVKRIYPQR